MNVLHISTTDTGGAGLCAYKIHKTLLGLRVNSKMLVLDKEHDDPTVIQVFRFQSLLFRGWHKLLRLLRIYRSEYDYLIRLSSSTNKFYSRPTSPFDISFNRYVQEADVIHLHWVDNYFDLPSFFKNINKPIIWTLHDEGLFYGIAHYSSEAISSNLLENKYLDIKKHMIVNRNNVGIVFLSNYFYKNYHQNEIIRGCHKRVINNFVDCSSYTPISRNNARDKFGIPHDKIVFLFIAAKIDDPRKGLDKLIKAIEQLNNSKAMILAIGKDTSFTPNKLVKTTGSINNTKIISEAISTADYYVMPSTQEAFAQAPIEAMACGVPAVVFPVSGTEELINYRNGIVCENFEVSGLLAAIKIALSRTYSPQAIREDVYSRFNPNSICRKYIDFYEELLSSQ